MADGVQWLSQTDFAFVLVYQYKVVGWWVIAGDSSGQSETIIIQVTRRQTVKKYCILVSMETLIS